MTTLYYDASATTGLQAGSGTMDLTTACWNVASDGTGARIAFSNGDDAVFSANGSSTITISGTVEANSVSIEGTGYTLTGGTLQNDSYISFSHNATIHSVISGYGTFVGMGYGITLTLDAANTYAGGTTVYGIGTVDFQGDAFDHLVGDNITLLNAETLSITGSVTWEENAITASQDSIIDISGDGTVEGGTWTLNTGSQIIIQNGGSFTVDGGDVTVYDFQNHGDISILSGSLEITHFGDNKAGANFTWSGGDLILTDSTLLNNGDMTIDGSSPLTLGGTGELHNNDGTFTWSGGDLTTTADITNGDNGTLTLDAGADTLTLDGSTLTNPSNSTISWLSGILSLTNSASITNDSENSATFTASFATPTIELPDGAVLDLSGGSFTGTLINDGILHLATAEISHLDILGLADSELSVFNITLADGSWDLSASAVLRIGGSTTIDGGDIEATAFQNVGVLNLAGGSLTINDPSTISPDSLDESDSTNGPLATFNWTGGDFIIADGIFTNTHDFNIDGGANALTLSGAGVLRNWKNLNWISGDITVEVDVYNITTASAATITLDGGSDTLTLDGASLFNGADSEGSLNWESGTVTGANSGAIINEDADGATFTVGSGDEVSLSLAHLSITGTLTIDGILHWADTNLTFITNFDGSGTVKLDANVALSGLTFTTGKYVVTSGHTATVSSTLTLTGATLTVASGGTLDWTGGDLSIGTSATLYNYGTVDWTGDDLLIGTGRSVYNHGTLNWESGDLSIGTSANFYNDGTLTITTAGAITGSAGVSGFHDYSALGAEVFGLVDGKTAPTFGTGYTASTTLCDIFNGNGTANTSGWWETVDLTAIPRSGGNNGVLITSRDMIFAKHSVPSMHQEITFLGSNGTPYTRRVAEISYLSVGHPNDIAVVTLEAVPLSGDPDELPSAYVHPLDLLPSGFENYNLGGTAALPVVFTNQDKRLLIGEYDVTSTQLIQGVYYPNEVTVTQSSNTALDDFYYIPRGGDSGSPVMVVMNGKLVLMTTWHSGTSGPSVALYLTAIQDAIDANATALSITGQTLTTADLSGFTDYSALL